MYSLILYIMYTRIKNIRFHWKPFFFAEPRAADTKYMEIYYEATKI